MCLSSAADEHTTYYSFVEITKSCLFCSCLASAHPPQHPKPWSLKLNSWPYTNTCISSYIMFLTCSHKIKKKQQLKIKYSSPTGTSLQLTFPKGCTHTPSSHRLYYHRWTPVSLAIERAAQHPTTWLIWCNIILNKAEAGNYVNLLAVDYSKAFDRFDVTIALQHLHRMNVGPELLPWIADFLSNREQCVNLAPVPQTGWPQPAGSPRGPKLVKWCFWLWWMGWLRRRTSAGNMSTTLP